MLWVESLLLEVGRPSVERMSSTASLLERTSILEAVSGGCQEKAVEHPMAVRGYHDQIHFFATSCLHDFTGWITFEQQASDGNPIESDRNDWSKSF